MILLIHPFRLSKIASTILTIKSCSSLNFWVCFISESGMEIVVKTNSKSLIASVVEFIRLKRLEMKLINFSFSFLLCD